MKKWEQKQKLETIEGYKVFGEVREDRRLLETTEVYRRLLETTRDYWKLLENTGDTNCYQSCTTSQISACQVIDLVSIPIQKMPVSWVDITISISIMEGRH